MSHEDPIDKVIETYFRRLENNEPVDQDQLIAENPEFADQLASFFQLHHQAKSVFGVVQNAAFEDSLQNDDDDAFPASAWSWNRLTAESFPFPFGPYDLIEEINRGGMGIVYRAVHRDLKRSVALKVMRAGELASAEELHRFRNEALASSALKHPNIIPIFEIGQEHGLVFFTMAYIEGEDLETRLRRAPVDPLEAANIVAKVADAVSHAHLKHIIHRDIKPSNILLDESQEPFLADFGLANIQTADANITATGQILGTPAYMAPEQAVGHSSSHPTLSADIYALGAVLYATLTRQPPFAGPSPLDVLLQLLDRQPPRPSQLNRSIPKSLEAICLKAMAKKPADRYQSASALAGELRRFLRGEPIPIERPTLRQQLTTWWQREPMLISHFIGIGAAASIMIGSSGFTKSQSSPERFALKLGILVGWAIYSYAMQILARRNQRRGIVYLAWGMTDVITFSVLMLLADPPRGLLLIGYPMMVVASGLFYRVRYVAFMTCACFFALLTITFATDDLSLTTRPDFIGIFLSGLVLIGVCVVTMIRRIRKLSRYCGASEM